MKIKVTIILTCMIKFLAAFQDPRFSNSNWEIELEFWRDQICSVRNIKSINFHGILADKYSVTLEFFHALTRDVGESCGAIITLKTHYFNYNYHCKYNHCSDIDLYKSWKLSRHSEQDRRVLKEIFSNKRRRNPLKKIEKIKKPNRVDTWEMNVILLSDDNGFDKIFDKISADWNPLQNFVVLSFWQYVNQNKSLTKIDNVLKTFWYRRSIQSVFLSVPFSTEERTIYTYNPFARADNSGWGKIERVDSAGDVLLFLSNLTERRTKNLNGYKLNVGMFESFITAKKLAVTPAPGSVYEYSAGYDGSDGIALGTIARNMNFTTKIVEPSDGLTFGTLLENGSYVGSMGDLVYGRINMSFVSYFVKIYGNGKTNAFDFSSRVEYDKMCLVVPRALRIPKWLRIFHIFSPSVWVYSAFFQIIMYTLWYYIRIYSPKSPGRVEFKTIVLEGVLAASGYPVKISEAYSERILLAGSFLSSVTMIGILCGSLYTSFSKGMRYKNINSLQELSNSDLPISYTTYGLSEIFTATDDEDVAPIMASLKKKLIYNSNSVIQAALYRNTSGIMRMRHFKLLREELVDKSGTYLIHVVPECPAQYYFAYLLPKHSILRERMNVLIEGINQAGLSNVWNERNIKHGILVRKIARKAKFAHRKKGVFFRFRLLDMQTSFYTLCIGLTAASIVFFHERGWFRLLWRSIRGRYF